MTYPTAAAVMSALRAKGFKPSYTPPDDSCDGEIAVTTDITIQRCLYAGGYAVNRWYPITEEQESWGPKATIPEILIDLSIAMSMKS